MEGASQERSRNRGDSRRRRVATIVLIGCLGLAVSVVRLLADDSSQRSTDRSDSMLGGMRLVSADPVVKTAHVRDTPVAPVESGEVGKLGAWRVVLVLTGHHESVTSVQLRPADKPDEWTKLRRVPGRPNSWSGMVNDEGPTRLAVHGFPPNWTSGIDGPKVQRGQIRYEVTLHSAEVALYLDGTPDDVALTVSAYRVTDNRVEISKARWTEGLVAGPNRKIPVLSPGRYLVTARFTGRTGLEDWPTFNLREITSPSAGTIASYVVERMVVGMTLIDVRPEDSSVHARIPVWPARITGSVVDPAGLSVEDGVVVLEGWGDSGMRGVAALANIGEYGTFSITGPRGLDADLVSIVRRSGRELRSTMRCRGIDDGPVLLRLGHVVPVVIDATVANARSFFASAAGGELHLIQPRGNTPAYGGTWRQTWRTTRETRLRPGPWTAILAGGGDAVRTADFVVHEDRSPTGFRSPQRVSLEFTGDTR